MADILFIFLLVVTGVLADIEEDWDTLTLRIFPDNPNKCTLEDFNISIPLDGEYTPDEGCRKFSCGAQNGSTTLNMSYCREMPTNLRCFKAESSKKGKFPQCCDKSVCPSDDDPPQRRAMDSSDESSASDLMANIPRPAILIWLFPKK